VGTEEKGGEGAYDGEKGKKIDHGDTPYGKRIDILPPTAYNGGRRC
jgi:hypothetical protein